MSIISSSRIKLMQKLFHTKWYRNLIDNNPRRAIGLYYFKNFGHFVNWKNPKSLNEKILWLSVYSDTSLWAKYSDKYEVREYLDNLGYKNFQTTLYGVWEKVEDIDYSLLPNRFVIKCTHDSHSTYIINDKEKLDIVELNNKLSKHLSTLYGYKYCEPHYNKIKPRIIAEELLIQEDLSFSTSMIDYKFFCINNKARCCMVCYDRPKTGVKNRTKKEIYDIHPWRPNHKIMSDLYLRQNFDIQVPRPSKLDEMIKMAEKLSEGFPIVRVDFYNIGDRVIFGELTFTPAGGRMTCFSEEAQVQLAKDIEINICT